MTVRKTITLALGLLMLIVALANGAAAMQSMPAHQQRAGLHQHDCAQADGHPHECAATPMSPADDACSPSRHACCPGLAATLPDRLDLPTFDGVREPIGYRSGLRLVSRSEGIFKPPR